MTNFMLGLLLAKDFLGINISQDNIKIMLLAYFQIYYLLLLVGCVHYLSKFISIYKKYKIGFILFFLFFGLIALFVISYKILGIGTTLGWSVSTIVTIILFYVSYLVNKEKPK